MRKLYFLPIAIILLAGTIRCTSSGEEEEKVAAAVEIFRKGVVEADKAMLESITAGELIYVHSNGRVQDRDECIEEIVSGQPYIYKSVDMSDQTITVTGNTAIVRHIYSAETLMDTIPGQVRIGNMMIWQKQNGEWRLIARQSFRL
jgi:hypothetical protein